MKYATLSLIVAGTLMMVGCNDDPQPVVSQLGIAPQMSSDADRVSVTKLSVFSDSLAYENRRGVYLIKDKQTGQEFIGVSGIGITEVGRHGCGKGCSHGDER